MTNAGARDEAARITADNIRKVFPDFPGSLTTVMFIGCSRSSSSWGHIALAI